MKINEVKQVKVSIILSYIEMAVYVLVGLIFTPMMIKILGKSEYGIYNTAASTIALISVLNLGFTSGYIRFYSKYKVNNDTTNIYKLNGLLLLIYTIIAVIALIIGITLSFNLKLIFGDGFTQSELELARKLVILLTINISLSFPASVFSTIVFANKRFIFTKILRLIKTTISPLITIIALMLGFGSIGMVITTIIISILIDIAFVIYVFVKLENKFIFHDFEKGLFKEMVIFTSYIAINIIVDQVNWNVDKILIGRFLGSVPVAIYSVGLLLYNHFMTISITISSPFTPRVHEIVQKTKSEPEIMQKELSALFVKIARIQFYILLLILTGFIFFGMPFICQYWLEPGYETSYYVAVILMFFLVVPMTQNVGIEMLKAQDKHKFRSILYVVIALINVVTSIFLIQKFEIIGATVGTVISIVIGNIIIMNIYYHKSGNINTVAYWKNILRISLGLIIPVIVGVLIMLYLPLDNIYVFLGSIVGYSIIYFLSMYFLSMNNNEKNMIKEPICKIFKRKTTS